MDIFKLVRKIFFCCSRFFEFFQRQYDGFLSLDLFVFEFLPSEIDCIFADMLFFSAFFAFFFFVFAAFSAE